MANRYLGQTVLKHSSWQINNSSDEALLPQDLESDDSFTNATDNESVGEDSTNRDIQMLQPLYDNTSH